MNNKENIAITALASTAVLLVSVLILFLAPSKSHADNSMDPFREVRYCGTPERDVNGVITRDPKVIAAFRELNACPSTGLRKGACPNWSVNHIKPRACGGCDAVYNLAWMPNLLKSSAIIGVDRYERIISGIDAPASNCTTPPIGGINYPFKHGILIY
jgi:hypothetical protein